MLQTCLTRVVGTHWKWDNLTKTSTGISKQSIDLDIFLNLGFKGLNPVFARDGLGFYKNCRC